MFQSTLPYGSDFLIASPALPMPDFNPHSLTGATFSSNASSTSSAFQSTLPRGSDRNSVRCSDKICQFQSTLPRGSDPYLQSFYDSFFNFNPRSLAGATAKNLIIYLNSILFQSTLPRGSDQAEPIRPPAIEPFQSTLPRGSDRAFVWGEKYICFISVHAPSRERPVEKAKVVRRIENFNPRSLAGATSVICQLFYALQFQSTLPRGSDQIKSLERGKTDISIHAPSRERPIIGIYITGIFCISIHAPSRERRR